MILGEHMMTPMLVWSPCGIEDLYKAEGGGEDTSRVSILCFYTTHSFKRTTNRCLVHVYCTLEAPRNVFRQYEDRDALVCGRPDC